MEESICEGVEINMPYSCICEGLLINLVLEEHNNKSLKMKITIVKPAGNMLDLESSQGRIFM